ncbi:MAG: nucleoside recognition protein [Paludibacter sp.]|nr:nucleoside recognition protein [Paludibacter sp.]
MKTTYKRLYSCTLNAFPTAGKTIWWLLKIILPISFAVSVLQYLGVIAQIASYLTPAFSLIGLPGESAIVFISSIFLSLYAPIAIIATLPLDMREITILAVMCLITHNMIIETAIQKKTGSSALVMFSLRLITSFVAAYLLNLILPEQIGSSHVVQENIVYSTFTDMLKSWIIGAGGLSLKIILIITGLMILQNILKEFKILDIISKIFAPFMRFFGLSADSSFLWFVAQTLGLTYGSAVMIEQVELKEISPYNANLLNYHIAINHSLLEDTLLFVAIGVPAGWMIAPRFILAIIIVWGVRLLSKVGSINKKPIPNNI